MKSESDNVLTRMRRKFATPPEPKVRSEEPEPVELTPEQTRALVGDLNEIIRRELARRGIEATITVGSTDSELDEAPTEFVKTKEQFAARLSETFYRHQDFCKDKDEAREIDDEGFLDFGWPLSDKGEEPDMEALKTDPDLERRVRGVLDADASDEEVQAVMDIITGNTVKVPIEDPVYDEPEPLPTIMDTLACGYPLCYEDEDGAVQLLAPRHVHAMSFLPKELRIGGLYRANFIEDDR